MSTNETDPSGADEAENGVLDRRLANVHDCFEMERLDKVDVVAGDHVRAIKMRADQLKELWRIHYIVTPDRRL